VSFGVQSFVDSEAAAVGRLHTRAMCLEEIARMRTAGIENLNVDLIVGLPRQMRESWRQSVEVAITTGVPHVSMYMLEVDEDSRLGREVLSAGNREQGTTNRLRYSADAVPSDDAIAEWYAEACGWLEAAGIRQYEISNFARAGFESRHNIRYWRRGPYLGFGLDAHSMLRCQAAGVRWANVDDLDRYEDPGKCDTFQILPSQGAERNPEWIGREQAFEEAIFLGLRMNEGVDFDDLRADFGHELVAGALDAIAEIEEAGLIECADRRLRLTARGRVVSNEVFSRLLLGTPA
jgi:oxygen-independent coproporphyrinogen-3 oxidase